MSTLPAGWPRPRTWPTRVAAEITLDNPLDAYAKSWRLWSRFCAATGLPELEGLGARWWRS
ncbi:hypothetical protein AB0G32_14465 [Streptomyces sp. NPDC023723]|uniref:hypothetical protein n=1 Tax=Streptomyces sp. NPDC023723 TaxID=3154323 RepID=UPI00340BC1A1